MMMDPRIAFFDALARGWDAEQPVRDSMVQGLALRRDLLDLQPEMSLLEVGCGTGKTTGWLAEQVTPGRVTAIDFSPRMIECALNKQIDADFHSMDICSDVPGRACFDVVLCLHSFPHFRDQATALRHCAAALKSTGRLIVMHLAGSDHINQFHAQLEGAVQDDMLPVGDQWTPLLSQAGLEQVRLIDQEDRFFLEARRASPVD
jgi:ubiquinone/menaquinone biosynthesis C-methylase UbiE